MKVSYNWLKEYLGEEAPSPEKIEELLTFHSFEIEEVIPAEGDTVVDVDILPNRSSDCLCHRGVAREIASLTDKPLAVDPLREKPELKDSEEIEVNIADPKACPRFTASLITDIEVKESPDWLKARLKAIGQRPINNIVDATNYVMFAIGQPLHAYDADLFPKHDGKWRFGVRFAEEGEKVSLIAEGGKEEDRTVELNGTEQLIIDESSNTPIGLAGVKGGRFAGVHEGTKNIIIEAAHFDPIITRQTARRLGIVIDASKRFENEPSRELPPYAQSEIIKLILDIAGGAYAGTVDVYPNKPDLKEPVVVRVERANSLLGLSLGGEEMAELLERVGCQVELFSEEIGAIGPWERSDLNIEEDFIEEIGRVHGYSHVKSVVPETVPLKEINARHYYSEEVREALLKLGYSEVITSSFRKKDEIQLLNALASDKSYLRSSLRKNLAEVLEQNANLTDLLGTNDTRVFEIGTVFDKSDSGVNEHVSLCFGMQLKASGYTGKEDKVIEETVTALEEKIGLKLETKVEKGIAEINFSEVINKLPAPTEYKEVEKGEDVTYQPFSTYPFVSRDIAMWTEGDVSAEEVEQVLNEHTGDLRVRTTLFDEFSKDGKTSFAFRLVFQSKDRTLTDDEVNKVMESVYESVKKQGWEVR